MKIFTALKLPNGETLPNRIAKSAMEEAVATLENAPSENLIHLYRIWAKGGVGLMITGNVMIDRKAMTGPATVVLEDRRNLHDFKRWAEVSRAYGGHIWMQINHPGRQMQANLKQTTWAPSAIPMNIGKLSCKFNTPLAMSEEMIHQTIQRFAITAKLAEEAGFNGVQIHAAHGYLISQFLSPLTNHRKDKWGGSLENRVRILLEIITEVRKSVSNKFSVAVKLNSADFQRGGFSNEDAKRVVEMLNNFAVDLIELSGGSFEVPAMQGKSRDEQTLSREAYFLEFAKEISKVSQIPLMVTGGIRRYEIAEKVINDGMEMVGIATALSLVPDLPNKWKNAEKVAPQLKPIKWKNKLLSSIAYTSTIYYQLYRLSQNKYPKPNTTVIFPLFYHQIRMEKRAWQYTKRNKSN